MQTPSPKRLSSHGGLQQASQGSQHSFYRVRPKDLANPTTPTKIESVAFNTDDRHCTDFIFFILLLGMWAAMTVLGVIALKTGDPYRLIGPINENVSYN